MAGENVLDAKMTLENSGFISAMSKARESTSKAMEVMKAATLGLTGLGAAFGAFRSVEGVIEGVMGAFERGRQLMDLSKQTTTNVRDLVVLQQAFRDTGASADGVGHTVFMLQKALGGVSETGEPTATVFQKLGLSIAGLKGMDTVSQFQAIAKGLSGLRDPSEQSAAAMKIFGRSAMEVMGLLRDPAAFGKAVQNVGPMAAMMEKNAAAFDKVSKSMELIKTNVGGLFAGIASGLAPLLQKVADTVNRIDFTKWGEKIGQSIQMIMAVFTSGKLTDIVGLSLTIGFKQAINVMYGAIFGMAGAMQAAFRHIPEILKDAFSMLTNRNFWTGIGELLLGAFMSIQGRIAAVFVYAADALGNRLADVLDHIPFFKGTVEKLRAQLNAGAQVAGNALGGAASKGDAMTAAGAGKIAASSGTLAKDYLSDLADELKSFQGAFAANKAFNNIPEMKQLQDVLAKIASTVKTIPEASPANDNSNQQGGLGRTSNYKAPDADRLARIGLFVGGAPSAPGLSEAKRTAAATEKANGLLKHILIHFSSGRVSSDLAYAE